jgi:molybdopterin/thiamine biosynthesis adenylyltransferase
MPSTLDRYRRQMQLPAFGEAGQARLRSARVLVAGCGALGTVVCEQLARAGVGTLTIIDRDVVERSNLQRQTLFTEVDAARGVPKAEAAKARLAQVNGEIIVRAFVDDLVSANALRYTRECDLLVDCLDNFETRYLLNDCAVAQGLPLVYGGAVGFRGMAAALLPITGADRGGAVSWNVGQSTPCLRCIAPDAPLPGEVETCESSGVLASAVGIAASIEAALALRLLAESPLILPARLVRFDLARLDFTSSSIAGARDEDCPCCAAHRFASLERQTGAGGEGNCRVLCGRNAVELRIAGALAEAELERIAVRLAAQGMVVRDRVGATTTLTVRFHGSAHDIRQFALDDVRSAPGTSEIPAELDGWSGSVALTVLAAERATFAIITGTTDPERARALFARVVGL